MVINRIKSTSNKIFTKIKILKLLPLKNQTEVVILDGLGFELDIILKSLKLVLDVRSHNILLKLLLLLFTIIHSFNFREVIILSKIVFFHSYQLNNYLVISHYRKYNCK